MIGRFARLHWSALYYGRYVEGRKNESLGVWRMCADSIVVRRVR